MADKLTPKQEAFVREFPTDLNATQAAVRAGYSEKTAHSAGPRLLANVGVAAALEKVKEVRAEQAGVTQGMVLDGLLTEAQGKGEDTTSSARTKAWELLGKHLGMLVERRDSVVRNIDEGTDEDVVREIKRLNRQLGVQEGVKH